MILPALLSESADGDAGPVFAAWNPADKYADLVLSSGNLTVNSTTSVWGGVRATQGKSSGKWYFETTIDVETGTSNRHIGVANSSWALSVLLGYELAGAGWGFRDSGANGASYYNKSATAFTGLTNNTGDVVMVAFDMDTGKLWWGVNGIWSGDPSAGTGEAYASLAGTLYPALSLIGITDQITANFGATAFMYTVPTGFNAGVFE